MRQAIPSEISNTPDHTFCVAPMLDWTDRHCRYFHRLLSSKALLYSEMVTTNAIIHGNTHHFLKLNDAENPVAFQLGGSDPTDLAHCAQIIEDYGYDEVNLNIGCPSDRVQNARFGACLMAEPQLVAECFAAMQQSVSIPVTIKTRIGIDDQDSYSEFHHFINTLLAAGCNTVIIHARKALLSGLSPKQNRTIPALRYDFVYQIKKDFPELEVVLNGGVTSIESAKEILKLVDGVMVGREAYHNPYLLAQIDRQLYDCDVSTKTREDVVMELIPYIQQHLQREGKLHNVTRHILGLFHGVQGAKVWRRILSDKVHQQGADESVVMDALKAICL